MHDLSDLLHLSCYFVKLCFPSPGESSDSGNSGDSGHSGDSSDSEADDSEADISSRPHRGKARLLK